MEKKRSHFSGKVGYVLAAAGASVGLGNIWRFPYLAAKYGGGAFLLVYIILALTFGYTMIISETVIGRISKRSPIGAFQALSDNKVFHIGGWINAIIPMLIVPYYSTIGGWVLNYLFQYIVGNTNGVVQDTYFTSFITNGVQTETWFIIFALCSLAVVFAGVHNGIERVAKFMMPVLVVLSFVIAIYSMTRPGALEGIKYFLIPNFDNFSWMTVVAAMGQMFYSLSIAMGILITFGSYMKDDVHIEEATVNVEIFDTGIAIMAGLMIIPAVFAFSNGDANQLGAGPSLMFITLPKVFSEMGMARIMGIIFFVLVFFAALTSAIALSESAISTFEDELNWSRKRSTIFMALIMLVFGSLSSLGYGPLANVTILGKQFLDFFDFLTNSVMMPIAAIFICLYIIKVIGFHAVEHEMTKEGGTFKRKGLYQFMIKYLCIAFLLVILISSILQVLEIIII